jgi:hypothetical protein
VRGSGPADKIATNEQTWSKHRPGTIITATGRPGKPQVIPEGAGPRQVRSGVGLCWSEAGRLRVWPVLGCRGSSLPLFGGVAGLLPGPFVSFEPVAAVGPGTAPRFGQGSCRRYSGPSGAREGFPDRAALEGFRAPRILGLRVGRARGGVELSGAPHRWRAGLAAAVIPSPGSSCGCGRGHGAFHVRPGRVNQRRVPPGSGGQTCGRPRAGLRLRWSCGCRMVLGQGADVAVAQAVEDQGEQAAGSGDLRDVLCLLAAAGDDLVLYGADR